METLLTYKTAAAILDCSESTVQKAVLTGELKILKIGNETRIDPGDLRTWIESKKFYHESKKRRHPNSSQPLPSKETVHARP